VERRRALPLPIKAALAATVVLLSMGILWVASGAVGPMVDGAVKGLGNVVSSIGNVVASPDATEPPAIADAPTIDAPDEPYTNDDVVDLTVNVPAAWVGKDGYTVRLWVTLPDKDAELLDEVAVGPTSVLVMPDVELQKGRNDFQASINGPGGESELSGVTTWVLDQSRPKITITTPKASSSTTKDTVTVKGKTQGRSTVRIKNDLSTAVVTVEAGKDGLFEAKIGVEPGINTLTVTAVDPAGNPNTETLTVRKGSGDMQVSLSGTAYRFTAKRLPRTVRFTVVVTDPAGRRLPGAIALFTVSVPGLEAIVSDEKTTDGHGVASFTTSIPKGAMPGAGLASVLVTTDNYGLKTDRQVLTVR